MTTSTSRNTTVLLAENLERLKTLLDRQWGNQELHDTAFFYVSGPMEADAAVFGQQAKFVDMAIAANILVPILAEYINEGLLDPEKISAYITKINSMTAEELAEKIASVGKAKDG